TYVAVAVVGGIRVTSGSLSLGEVQAFIQYTRQFNQPVSQVASMANLMQSGVASAERVFELLDAPEESDGGTAALTPGAGEGGRSEERRVGKECRARLWPCESENEVTSLRHGRLRCEPP